ncbi:MAG: hypothetical protein OK439_00470 [Thaumarchaeota archaeon]|nr:hypothetical protein [Nitrososphaerota archaeon]
MRAKGVDVLDALFKVENTDLLPTKLKKRIALKMKNVLSGVSEIEKLSGLRYPAYYIEPVLTVTVSQDNIDGMGVLYARTIPVDKQGMVEIVVQLTAPLLLYSTKSTMKLVLGHEFLHYLELVRNFSKGLLSTQLTTDSIYEEEFADSARGVEPSRIFKDKKIVKDLKKTLSKGLSDEKLNEKCRINWIEKGLPMARIPMARNQVKLSMESVLRSRFDPNAVKIVSELN